MSFRSSPLRPALPVRAALGLALGFALAGATAALAPSLAEAQYQQRQRVVVVQPVVREPYTHTGGFFGRFQIGPAFSYSAYDVGYPGEPDLEWGGGALNLSLSLGFSLPSPAAVALHVDFLGDYAWEPEVYDGDDLWTLYDTGYATSGFGVGVTHWFPRNGFITGGFGFAVASLINDYVEYDSDVGGYLTFGGGMEWWVAPRFGVGVYGRLTGYRLPDQDYDASFTTVAPSVGLSMSFD